MVLTDNFPKRIYFGANEQFGTNLGQNYVTLHLMISCKILFEMLQDDGAQYMNKTVLVNFPQNFILAEMGNWVVR